MRRIALLLICAMIAACQAPTSRAARPSAEVTDSSGVSIITSHEPGWTDMPWSLALEPRLSIGMVDGPEEYQFTSIRSALRLPDSRIVVASFRNPPDIRFYAPDGSHLFTVGRDGDGPGEFRVVSWIEYLSGDTLRVLDSSQARLSYFDLDGKLLAAEPIRDVAGRPVRTLPIEPGFSNGDFLVPVSPRSQNQQHGRFRVQVPLLLVSLSRPTIDTLVTVSGTEYFIQASGWGKQVKFGAGPPGTLADTDRFLVTTGEAYRIDEYSKDGVLRRSFRRIAQRRPVRPEDVAALEANQLQRTPNAESRRWVNEIPHADSMPVYRGTILLDSEANIWARHYSSPLDSIAQWDVFNPEGQYVGTVEIPLAFELFQVGSDEVIGRWRDELGVESIRVYGLVKQR